MKFISILFATLFLCIAAPAGAVEVDLKKLPPDIAKQVEAAVTPAPAVTPPVVNPSSEWMEFGKAMGVTVSETAKALAVEANEFIQSPTGTFVMFIIFWKLLGASAVGGAIKIAIVLFLWFGFWRVVKATVLPVKVVGKDGVEEWKNPEFDSTIEPGALVCGYFFVAAVLMLITAFAIF